jgi:hypothetical protein
MIKGSLACIEIRFIVYAYCRICLVAEAVRRPVAYRS